MANPAKFTERRPNDILENELLDGSSWHFFQALSWLDYAKRSQKPSAIHYVAFELRYGIEYLLFELVVLNSKFITRSEYEKCLGDPKRMKQMLFAGSPNFKTLCEFTEITLSVDSGGIKLRFWDVNELFRYWGIASSYLHFVGAHKLTYCDLKWLIEAIAKLEDILEKIWKVATQTHGIGVMRPDLMEAEVYDAWLEFCSGKLTKENLKLRLKLIQPVLQIRNRAKR